MSDRQPIATAPRDGTRVRLFHERDSQESDIALTSGMFEDGRWIMNQAFIIERDGRLLMASTPTHWAPLAVGACP